MCTNLRSPKRPWSSSAGRCADMREARGPNLRMVGMATATLIVALAGRDANALTRADALAKGCEWVNYQYTISSANVYPQGASCYQATAGFREKLPAGYQTGVVYAYSRDDTPSEMAGYLAAGRGAGNSKALYDLNSGCVRDYCTGIDCSAFVSRIWEVTRTSSTGLTSSTISAAVIDQAHVGKADILDLPGSHVLAFEAWTNSGTGDFTCMEASGVGSCREDSKNYAMLAAAGYLPYVANKLKDDPAANVAAFNAERGSGAVRVRWSTVTERNTACFVVCRAPSAVGPFDPCSEEISALGADHGGAEYEFVDVGGGQGASYYRLLEIESDGGSRWHWIVSTQEALPLMNHGTAPTSRSR